MNTTKILKKLTLWNDIENFYSFDNLIYLSNQYYDGVRILFAATDTIFDFNFYGTKMINPLINKKALALEVTYNELLFTKFDNKNDPNNINHSYNPWFLPEGYTFYKKDFKNQFKIKILDQVKDNCPIKKFCLLSELYENILDGVNI